MRVSHSPSGASEAKRAIHPDATVGQRCYVWEFARILAGAILGDEVSIGGGAEVGAGSIIGNGSRISAGVFLPAKSVVQNGVFIGPMCTFTDDKYPRVLVAGETYNAEPPFIGAGASIGAGCVILPGVRIGAQALVGAGSLVTADVPPGMLVYGSPARVIGPNPNLARS